MKLFDLVGYLISVAGRTLLDIRLRARRYRLGVETRMLRTLRGEAGEEVRIADAASQHPLVSQSDPVSQPREQPSTLVSTFLSAKHRFLRDTTLQHLDLAGHAKVDNFWYALQMVGSLRLPTLAPL